MRLTLIVTTVFALGCGVSAEQARDRYVDAVNMRMAGDQAGAQAALIALAHEAPNTRAGRRARAILAGSSMTVGTLALTAAMAQRNKATEAKTAAEARRTLRGLHAVQLKFIDEQGMVCQSLDLCGLDTANLEYLYFLGTGAPRGGTQSPLLRLQAERALTRLGVESTAGDRSFRAFAVGNLDDDDDLDIWTIDQDGVLVQIADDTAPSP